MGVACPPAWNAQLNSSMFLLAVHSVRMLSRIGGASVVTYSGQCLGGSIRYQFSGEPNAVALCHCVDCRRSAGAPMIVWATFPEASLSITKGSPKTINSSGTAMRSFCPDCGSGLFYRNAEVLPGIVGVQSSTLDDPNALPPTMQIQTAERLAWVKHVQELPAFERFPA